MIRDCKGDKVMDIDFYMWSFGTLMILSMLETELNIQYLAKQPINLRSQIMSAAHLTDKNREKIIHSKFCSKEVFQTSTGKLGT